MTSTVKINAADHTGLVYHIAKKYSNVDFDEAISAGNFALVKAANTFDAEKGVKFATYAARCITNEILMLIRKNKNSPQCIPMLCYGNNGEDYDMEEFSCNFAYYEKYEAIEELDALKTALDRLNERDRQIIVMRYYEEKKQNEVCDILGVSQSYVSRLEKRALKTLRRYMEV
jgi:RNA polymerase sporulation-specific sigma factor